MVWVGLVAAVVLASQATPPQTLPVTPSAVEVLPPKPLVLTYPVSGAVVDETGKSVPGADCFIRTPSGRGVDLTADSEGRFSVKLKSVGPYSIWATSGKRWSKTPAKTDGALPTTVVLSTAETKAVEGRVVDETGAPVPGARVDLSTTLDPMVTFIEGVRTDAEGRYRFEDVFTGAKLRLSASARGMSHVAVPGVFTADTPPSKMVLQRADQTVHGRVIGPDGKPVAGAVVQCVNGGRGRPVETDLEGRFVLGGLVSGPVSLGAWSGNMIGNAFVPNAKEEVTIKLGDQGPLQAFLATMPDEVTPGVVAPPFETSHDWVNSPPLTLEGLKGKVVVLDFWGMWCPPCLEEVPEMVKLHADFPDVALIGIHALLATRDKLARFAQVKGMTWPLVMDGEKVSESVATSYAYGIRGFPTLVVIGVDGNVAWVGHRAEEARPVLEALIHKR